MVEAKEALKATRRARIMRFADPRHDAAAVLFHDYFGDHDPTISRHVQTGPIGLARSQIKVFLNGIGFDGESF